MAGILGGCPTATPQPEPDAPAPQSAPGLVVAEWGLVMYGPTATEVVSGVAPNPIIPPPHQPWETIDGPPVRKPVIYLLPEAGWHASTPVSVRASFAAGGRMHEVWPTPANGAQPSHGAAWTWSDVKITRGACAAGWAPQVGDAACHSLPKPDACEAAMLEAWVPEGATCLDVAGVRAGALLYNGFPPEGTGAPLAEVAPGRWKNTSKHAIGPFLARLGDGVVHRVENLEAGAELQLSDATREAAREKGAEALAFARGELLRQGMPEGPANDFLRAWGPLLLGDAGWTVFGFLGAPAIEELATLAVTPAPTRVVRVMAFAIEP
jgi:hypothetical protein